MIFHKFFLKNKIQVIILEVQKKEYVWLSFYLHRNLRNRILSKELAKHLLYFLKGRHHIHWFPAITTFRELAKELKWPTQQTSVFFYGCHSSQAKQLKKPSICSPLFLATLEHRKLKNCPPLKNFISRKEELKVIRIICEHFKKK